ncbi:MAG: aldo/keto reductase [Proteobacteria bacterium]|nr:aldo/keto reductase [Pseudomonadota bacterium]MBS0494631.1 aldo/keto reductase [Pseudomonadota bacterium]
MTTPSRTIGHTGITLAPLVFGGNVLGWTADQPTSFALLDRLLDAGLTTIDTADMYSSWAPGHVGGESEAVIGAWLQSRGVRDRVQLMTKVGLDMGAAGKGLSAAYIERAVEASLKRLRTDRIDVYFSHQFDASVPQAETLAAYDRLIKAGKVRAIGASNFSARQLREALDTAAAQGLPRYQVLQPHYNLIDRAGFDGPLRDLAMAEGMAVVTYFSLASGFLTGKYRSADDLKGSARGDWVKGYLNPRGLRILDALDAVAARHAAQPGEVALAWLMARPGVTAPIASATKLDQLEGLIRATRLALSADDIAALGNASAEQEG